MSLQETPQGGTRWCCGAGSADKKPCWQRRRKACGATGAVDTRHPRKEGHKLAALAWNQWQLCPGIGGSIGAEYAR